MITFLTLINNETDSERFRRIYDHYKQPIFACAYKILGDEGYAEDAVQEAFLRIATNIGRYDFNSNLIMTIARNAALSILKKQNKEIAFDDIEALSVGEPACGGYDYDVRNDTERIFEIVSTMPKIYSDVFYLRFSHGLKFSEIAELLGITVATAKKRVQRTKEHIRSQMGKEEQHNEADQEIL